MGKRTDLSPNDKGRLKRLMKAMSGFVKGVYRTLMRHDRFGILHMLLKSGKTLVKCLLPKAQKEKMEAVLTRLRSESMQEPARKLEEIRRDMFSQKPEEYDLPVASNAPLVTVIVPAAHRGADLRSRLASIVGQSYRNMEILLLDDGKNEEESVIVNECVMQAPEKMRILPCECGLNAAEQWKMGIAAAKGNLIWIAEGEDRCEEDFLEKLVPAFERESVQAAFARTVLDAQAGEHAQEYEGDAAQSLWNRSFYDTAHHLAVRGFELERLIPSISGMVFRRMDSVDLSGRQAWEAMSYCGAWVLCLSVLKGGMLYYSCDATNFCSMEKKLRQTQAMQTEAYYCEREAVSCYIAENYRANLRLFRDEADELRGAYNGLLNTDKPFERLYSLERIDAKAEQRLPNVMICTYGFLVGGGEIFPLQLAGALKRCGAAITFVNCLYAETVEQVRRKLPYDVSVVNLREPGDLAGTAAQFGAEIIHTHHATIDKLAAEYALPLNPGLKQVITLHGMYEALSNKEILQAVLDTVVKSCDRFVYIAQKNLDVFKDAGCYDESRFTQIANGMPRIQTEPVSRAALDIPENAFVLCLVSRALLEKGWLEAVEIVNRANEISEREIHLILVGGGEAYDRICEEGYSRFIHPVGVQQNTAQYYLAADMGFLPSRYAGESFPLVVIESLLCGKPVLASDLGEIRNMLMTGEERMAGCVFCLQDMQIPVDEVAALVLEVANDEDIYERMKAEAETAAKRFDIDRIAKQYMDLYEGVLH